MSSGSNIPRSERKSPRVEFSLSRAAYDALQKVDAGQRSAWVSKLILRASRRLGWKGKGR